MVYAVIGLVVLVALGGYGYAKKTGATERWKERARQWRKDSALTKEVDDHMAKPVESWADRARRILQDRGVQDPSDEGDSNGGGA